MPIKVKRRVSHLFKCLLFSRVVLVVRDYILNSYPFFTSSFFFQSYIRIRNMLNCFESRRLQLLPSTSQITPFQASMKRRAFILQQEATSIRYRILQNFYICYCLIHLLPFQVLMLFVNKKLSVPLFPKSDSHINNVPKYLECNSYMLENIPARSAVSSE